MRYVNESGRNEPPAIRFQIMYFIGEYFIRNEYRF